MKLSSLKKLLPSGDIVGWPHWLEDTAGPASSLDHEEYRSQFMLMLGASQDGGTAVSECLHAAARIMPGDSNAWYREWKRIGDESKIRGDRALALGNIQTAQTNWLRASNYFRSAQHFLDLDDPRRLDAFDEMEKCSRLFLNSLKPQGEVIEISVDNGSDLVAYFIRAPNAPAKTPVVICLDGSDRFKDAQLYKMERHALRRGLSLLLVDIPSPKAGSSTGNLNERHTPEVLIGFFVDYLLARSDVDGKRIVLYGDGLGSSQASLAASIDDRFAAVVCDGGLWDQRERSFLLEWVSGVHDTGWIKEKARKLRSHCLALKIKCPCLMAVNDNDFLFVEDAVELHKFCHESGVDIELRVFSAVPSKDASIQIDYIEMEKEIVFDWIRGKVLRRKGIARSKATIKI